MFDYNKPQDLVSVLTESPQTYSCGQLFSLYHPVQILMSRAANSKNLDFKNELRDTLFESLTLSKACDWTPMS